jgi:beta-1,4-mannosyltransferase
MTSQPFAGTRVAVVVLGDLGRSPRMLRHAAALLDAGAAVDLVGYPETPLPSALAGHARLTVRSLAREPLVHRHQFPRPLFLAYALARAVALSARLARYLFAARPQPDLWLMQTPPALPTLLLPALATRRRSRMVVDWHNLGYTQLGLTLGATHPVVRLARSLEGALAPRAGAHLCVSAALQRMLETQWRVPVPAVFRDRPGRFVVADTETERGRRRQRVGALLGLDLDGPQRPLLALSPTSWTADEDADLALEALWRCDAALAGAAQPPPRLVVVLTGEGPRRASFETRVAQARLQRVVARTAWLAPDDYAELLGAADVGLCLHRSSSRLDLPMKIVDCFGAGVPVCALDYGPTLREMVSPGKTGVLFRDAAELAAHVLAWLAPDGAAKLARLRAGVAALPRATWQDGWHTEALPVLRRCRDG